MDKIEKALEACEKVIDGIEDSTITTESALLLCTKIARLTNDEENLIWLQYEYGGYPENIGDIGNEDVWDIAYKKEEVLKKKGTHISLQNWHQNLKKKSLLSRI